MEEKQFANDYLVFKCIAGSYAYGTQIDGLSDKDERSLFIAPPSHILSCYKKVDQIEGSGDEDTVAYELRKFMKLAAENNPNISELLWCDESDILFQDWPYQELRKNRHLFLSKKSKYTYLGYAYQQLKRVKNHCKWIMNPAPVDPPKISDFCKFIGLNGNVVKDPNIISELQKECFLAETFGYSQFRIYKSPDFFKDKLGFFNKAENDVKFVNIHDDVLKSRATYVGVLWINLDDFKKQHSNWKHYWEWKNNRNPVRAELEEKYNFDTKHASHLVRLLSSCKEILTTHELLVKRPDASFLKDIRAGKYSYEWILKWAEEAEKELNDLYDKSTLRHSADYEAIDNLYRKIVMKYWEEKNLM